MILVPTSSRRVLLCCGRGQKMHLWFVMGPLWAIARNRANSGQFHADPMAKGNAPSIFRSPSHGGAALPAFVSFPMIYYYLRRPLLVASCPCSCYGHSTAFVRVFSSLCFAFGNSMMWCCDIGVDPWGYTWCTYSVRHQTLNVVTFGCDAWRCLCIPPNTALVLVRMLAVNTSMKMMCIP